MNVFNKYVDWAARTFLGIDNNIPRLCEEKIYQHREEKCYISHGDMFCRETDQLVTTRVRKCVIVDRFAVDYKMFLAQYQGLK